MSNCRPQCGLEDICPVCDPQLNARLGKTYPAAHQGEVPQDHDATDSWIEFICICAVCVVALLAAIAPALI
jgi:hypothetical protein